MMGEGEIRELLTPFGLALNSDETNKLRVYLDPVSYTHLRAHET